MVMSSNTALLLLNFALHRPGLATTYLEQGGSLW